jgi:formylglycine-generating enzyme required for sulfatase activity
MITFNGRGNQEMNFINPKDLFQRLVGNKAVVAIPEMIQVNGGTFLMGSDENDETPVHEVELDSFLIGRFPVTQEFWVSITCNNPSAFKSYKDLPVESVSWENVMEFIQKLNKISGKNFRLPTEAEWEYAARGGARTSNYPFSGSQNAEEVAWLDTNSNKKTHPVGLLRPNELGIYDLCGNVWEWCSDWYDDEYRSDIKFRKNPKGPDFGTFRVLRGGSWSAPVAKCKVTSRFSYSGDFKNNCVGFRLAMDI